MHTSYYSVKTNSVLLDSISYLNNNVFNFPLENEQKCLPVFIQTLAHPRIEKNLEALFLMLLPHM